MNFPKFWVKVNSDAASRAGACWGWSDTSVAEARERALERSRRVLQFLRSGRTDRLKAYAYGTQPLREPVLQVIPGESAGEEPAAVITRNSSGCVVLNSARVMFVDIDLPQLEASEGPALLRKLFKKPSHQDCVNEALRRVDEWTAKNSAWGWRVYRTRAGLRLIATHALFDPASVASGGLFGELGGDLLYQKLCVSQKSFRARLTPKAWRIGSTRAPAGWPFENEAAERAHAEWVREYEAESGRWATCRFLRSIGDRLMHPGVAPIVALHDARTRAESTAELA